MRIVNLTGFPVSVKTEDGQLLTLPAEPAPARVEEGYVHIGYLTVDCIGEAVRYPCRARKVPIWETRYGPVEGLPEPEPDVAYVLPPYVAEALRGRPDIFIPAEAIESEYGSVIGYRGLERL